MATGTDHCGLNAFQHGDIVELETEGLGRLRVNVRDDLRRTWSRELRLDRHGKGLDPIAPQLTGKYASAGSGLNNPLRNLRSVMSGGILNGHDDEW